MEVARPRLTSGEVFMIYALLDNEYWRCRKMRDKSEYFNKISKLRRKFFRCLKKFRDIPNIDKISLKGRVGF
jgi:hypothetical protein